MRNVLLKILLYLFIVTTIMLVYCQPSRAAAENFMRQHTITTEFNCIATYVKYDIDFDWSENETCAQKNNLLLAQTQKKNQMKTVPVLPERRSDNDIAVVETIEEDSAEVHVQEASMSIADSSSKKEVVFSEPVLDEEVASMTVENVRKARPKKRFKRRFFFLI